jgi:predicted hotdog family 3-hydroxylacyl-ACP dehydratase
MAPTIEQLLPHRPPMRWVEALTDCTDTTATATVRFTKEHFAVAADRVIEAALIECMAQTVAAALGQRMQTGGKPAAANHGMLAAVSNFKILAAPPLDQTLQVEVTEVKRLGPMLMIAGKITYGTQLIATGDLSLYA